MDGTGRQSQNTGYTYSISATMHFDIIPIFERGKRRDWKVLRGLPRIEGDIQIHNDLQSPLGRASLGAFLFKSAPHLPDVLPPLYDVRLEGMATLAFVIEGVEFVDGQMYQQAWHCKVLDHKIQVPWTMCERSTLNELI